MMPVCVPCRKFYRPEKNGVIVEEGMPSGSRQPITDSSGWGPYKLWYADKLKCPDCGHELIYGYGADAFAHHFQSTYAGEKKLNPPDIFVPDCP